MPVLGCSRKMKNIAYVIEENVIYAVLERHMDNIFLLCICTEENRQKGRTVQGNVRPFHLSFLGVFADNRQDRKSVV